MLGLATYGLNNWYSAVFRPGYFTIDDMEQYDKQSSRLTAFSYPGIDKHTIFYHDAFGTRLGARLHDEAFHRVNASAIPLEIHPTLNRLMELLRLCSDKRWSAEIWLLVDKGIEPAKHHHNESKMKEVLIDVYLNFLDTSRDLQNNINKTLYYAMVFDFFENQHNFKKIGVNFSDIASFSKYVFNPPTNLPTSVLDNVFPQVYKLLKQNGEKQITADNTRSKLEFLKMAFVLRFYGADKENQLPQQFDEKLFTSLFLAIENAYQAGNLKIEKNKKNQLDVIGLKPYIYSGDVKKILDAFMKDNGVTPPLKPPSMAV